MDPMYDENTKFWTPYSEYDANTFEDTLQADYQRLYPQTSNVLRTSLALSTVQSLVLISLAVFILLLLICVVILVRRSMTWMGTSGSKTISEVAPLLVVES